jgi:hypothetical protein
MRLFIAILEGRSPKDAVPLFASEDPDLVRIVAEALTSRLGADQPSVTRLLRLATPDDFSDEKTGGTDA